MYGTKSICTVYKKNRQKGKELNGVQKPATHQRGQLVLQICILMK